MVSTRRPITSGTPVALAGTLVLSLFLSILLSFSTATAAHASDRSAAEQRPHLSYGDSGAAVRYVQYRLHVHPRSGYFGSITRSAVRAYRGRHGLHVSGVVGHRMWRLLLGPRDHSSASRHSPRRSGRSSWSRETRQRHAIIDEARSLEGVRYRYGGTSPGSGFDCSGFTRYVYRKAVHRHLPHSSAAQYRRTHIVGSHSAQWGDLVFFLSGSHVYHVGLYAGHHSVWHAPRTGERVHRERIWTSHVRYGQIL